MFRIIQSVTESHFKNNLHFFNKIQGVFWQIILFNFISFFFTWIFIFSGPEYFFWYFFYRFQGLFFIVDSNILASLYIQSVIFLSWFLFFPVIAFSIFFSIYASFTFFELKKLFYLFISFFFAHRFAYFINDFDLSYIPVIVNTKNLTGGYFSIERTDFSSYLNQYWGFFWDLFYFVFIYLSIWVVFLEFSVFYTLFICYKENNKNRVWIGIMYFRFVYFAFIYYFFGGDTSINNFIFIPYVFFMIELNIIRLRILIYLRTWISIKII